MNLSSLERYQREWRTPRVVMTVASGVLLLLGFGLQRFQLGAAQPLFLMAGLVGAWFFGRKALVALVRERQVTTELLMCVGAVTSAAVGHLDDAAILVFLTAVSEAAEQFTDARTRSAIRALMDLTPRTATRIRPENGGEPSETVVPVEELRVGDQFLARPGQAIPTDGVIQDGRSSVNEAPVTGESTPVEKGPGDPVFAGSLVGEGSLTIRATRESNDNTIARIVRMVQEAQESKAKSQRWVERFGRIYSCSVLGLGILIAVVPPLLGLGASRDWITRAAVVLVAAAPCALMISVPVTLIAALGAAARAGILIKGGTVLEDLAELRVMALDKTGTLTRGKPSVSEVLLTPSSRQASPQAALSEPDVLALAAGLEHDSQHPLARAILQAAAEAGVSPKVVTEFLSHTGGGVSGNIDGVVCTAGSPRLFREQATREPVLAEELARVEPIVRGLIDAGRTVVLLRCEEDIVGVLGLLDQPRAGAAAALRRLREVGVERVVMLSGDHQQAAEAVASVVGVDQAIADLQPGEKASVIERLSREYGPVGMVGDGVNDAPSLARASVGFAMGVAGTDVALETADVALMGDDLMKLSDAILLGKRCRTVVRQNLVASAVVIGSLIVLAVTGLLSLPAAVLAHEVSEVLVIASGFRMARVRV